MADVPSQKDFWDEWHRHRGASGHDEPHMELRNMFRAEMRSRTRAAVADLGCGQGIDAEDFAGAGMTVTAVDFAPEAIAKVRKLSPGVVPVRHDLSRPLPFGGSVFDGVYSHLALHYFDDATTHAIFAEIRRVLRPAGPFVFSVKSTADPYHASVMRSAQISTARTGTSGTSSASSTPKISFASGR